MLAVPHVAYFVEKVFPPTLIIFCANLFGGMATSAMQRSRIFEWLALVIPSTIEVPYVCCVTQQTNV